MDGWMDVVSGIVGIQWWCVMFKAIVKICIIIFTSYLTVPTYYGMDLKACKIQEMMR